MKLLRLTREALISADSNATALARISRANLALGPVDIASGPTVCWSGWLGDGADPERGLFPRDFHTWSRQGWDALTRSLQTMLPALTRSQAELWVRPNARHVLADPQGCFSFFRAREHQPIRLFMDPPAFLTGSMLASAEDHLARAFDALASHASVRSVVLSNVQRIDCNDEDALGPAPLHRGLLDPALILNPWRATCPPELPVALLDEDFEAQAAMLA